MSSEVPTRQALRSEAKELVVLAPLAIESSESSWALGWVALIASPSGLLACQLLLSLCVFLLQKQTLCLTFT